MSMREWERRGKQGRRSFRRLPAILLGGGVAAAAIYGGFAFTRDVKDQFTEKGKQGIHRDLLRTIRVGDENQSDYSGLILDYRSAKESFIEYAEFSLKNDSSRENIDDIHEKRKQLTLDGFFIAQELSQDGTFKIIDNNSVQAEGAEFDLENELDLYIADAIVNQKLTIYLDGESKYAANRNIEDLLWLKGAGLPLSFEKDTFIFPHEAILLNTSRFYRTIIDLNYPIPNEIRFRINKNDPYAGGFFDQIDKIDITDVADTKTIVHEGAHHQADENEMFGQERFESLVASAEARASVEHQLPDSYINPEILDDPNVNFESEDYAETIAFYFTRGAAFRNALNTLYVENNQAYYVLDAKYKFAKYFFQGKEYMSDGEEFVPGVGDVFKILDEHATYSGIYLRPEPGYVDDSTYKKVYDGDWVRVLEGPVEVEHNKRGARKVWRVERGFYNYSLEFESYDESGWISEDWLGFIAAYSEDLAEIAKTTE